MSKTRGLYVAFKVTKSLPGYNSIGVELGEYVELEEGDDIETVRSETFVGLKSKVQEYIMSSVKRPEDKKVAAPTRPSHVPASAEAKAYIAERAAADPDEDSRYGR